MTAFTDSNTLLVFALESEAQGLFDAFPKLYCGVGKVNAAYRLTQALVQWHQLHKQPPALVLNMGSAGSPKHKAGMLVNCTRFIQRDMDTTPLGSPAYVTPFDDTPAVLATGLHFADYTEGVCGSGDNFVTDGKHADWDVMDMEAYALAKVAMLEKVPFGCLRFITDGADGHAANTWEQALKDAARELRKALSIISPAHK